MRKVSLCTPRLAAIIETPNISRPHDSLWRGRYQGPLLRQANGWHTVSASFVGQLWQLPEVLPVDESCDAERTLHASLTENPTMKVEKSDIDVLADADARENYRVALGFRDRLIAAESIEAYYLTMFRTGLVKEPPVFIDLLAQAVASSLLTNHDDPFTARTSELLFREQRVTIQKGAILLGDSETVDRLGRTAGMGSLGALLTKSGTAPKQAVLDVLSTDNAERYWERSSAFDFVLDLTFGRAGIEALSRVLENWIAHFLEIQVTIEPVQEINDSQWVWHVGLDAEATALLNDLYNNQPVEDDRMERLLSLYRLDFKSPAIMRSDVAGRPIYLGLCMTETGRLRLKPQNLLVNLPLAADI